MPRIHQNKWLVLIFGCLVTILSGCNYNEKVNVVFFEPSDFQVYLYSDGENKTLENSYLSAILDLRISHPDLVNKVKVKETTTAGLKQKNIGEYPTLVIEKNGEVIEELSGEQKKQVILTQLEEIIFTDKQEAYLSSGS